MNEAEKAEKAFEEWWKANWELCNTDRKSFIAGYQRGMEAGRREQREDDADIADLWGDPQLRDAILEQTICKQHVWKSHQRGGDPSVADSYEWVTYCRICGAEKGEEPTP